jgi:hypothetical protein
MLAFVASDLDAPARAAVEDHVDECETCRRVLAELVRQQPTPGTDETMLASDKSLPPAGGEWANGARVGRYVVLARIGRGGMGSVFRAEDVELGRPVALKRLHAGADAESRARLVREARAAAQLQHPNVVTVLEVGDDAGTPFLAMELVDGVTLSAWLDERTRSWREITSIVAQAGRGLAAAHERGLVHRDFKPENVLVDRTGRARVADFGLARAGEDSEPGKPIAVDERLARMTATGSLAGTPAYMAPELVDGGSPDARSDQYAFAVTLYEALRGQHPFAGETAAKLWVEMAAGRVRAGGRPIPAWLDRRVRRGLEPNPAQRWPDLASLITAIERPPRRAWIYIASGAAAAAIAGTVAIASSSSSTTAATAKAAPCDDAVAPIAEVWPALRGDLQETQKRDPALTKEIEAGIDRFVGDWQTAARAACVAKDPRRTWCLDRARSAASVRIKTIAAGFAGTRASIASFPDLAACTHATAPPPATATREAIEKAEAELEQARIARDTGEARAAGRYLASATASLGDHDDPSLAARIALLEYRVARESKNPERATTNAAAALAAAKALGDRELVLEAELARITAALDEDPSSHALDGFALDQQADSPRAAHLEALLADAQIAAGRYADADASARRAQAIRERVYPKDHFERAIGERQIAAVLVYQQKYRDAQPLLERVRTALASSVAARHPEALEALRLQRIIELQLGNVDRAVALGNEHLEHLTMVYGPRSERVAAARNELVNALANAGKHGEAVTELEKEVALYVKRSGEQSIQVANARLDLATQLVEAGRFDEAEAAIAKARAVFAADRGEASIDVGIADYSLVRGRLLAVRAGKKINVVATEAVNRRAAQAFRKRLGPKSDPLAALLGTQAELAGMRGDWKAADALYVEALAMTTSQEHRGELALLRAKALWRLGRKDEARASAENSLRLYTETGPANAKFAEQARAWLAAPS